MFGFALAHLLKLYTDSALSLLLVVDIFGTVSLAAVNFSFPGINQTHSLFSVIDTQMKCSRIKLQQS